MKKGDYEACTIQDLFKLYQMIANREERSDKTESIREELFQWIEKVQQALKQ